MPTRLLGFDTQLVKKLRPSIQFLTGVLPLVGLFSTFIPLFPFAYWLGKILDIPEKAPVKDHPNGVIFMAIFLSGMVLLMLLGTTLGILLNLVVAHYFARWPWPKVIKVFLRSEVPNHWLKAKFQFSEGSSAE